MHAAEVRSAQTAIAERNERVVMRPVGATTRPRAHKAEIEVVRLVFSLGATTRWSACLRVVWFLSNRLEAAVVERIMDAVTKDNTGHRCGGRSTTGSLPRSLQNGIRRP